MSEAVQQLIDSMLSRAHREPLGVDVSDYSDEWCAGFLRGQTSALEELSFALTTEAALQRPTPEELNQAVEDAFGRPWLSTTRKQPGMSVGSEVERRELERRIAVGALALFRHDCACKSVLCSRSDGCAERGLLFHNHNEALNDYVDFLSAAVPESSE